MPRKGGFVCAYRGCANRTGRDLSFFRFPKDPVRANTWLNACNRRDLSDREPDVLSKNYKLCEEHFEDKFIMTGKIRKNLTENAIPTIFVQKKPKAAENAAPKKITQNIITISNANQKLTGFAKEENISTRTTESKIQTISIPGSSSQCYGKTVSVIKFVPCTSTQISAILRSNSAKGKVIILRKGKRKQIESKENRDKEMKREANETVERLNDKAESGVNESVERVNNEAESRGKESVESMKKEAESEKKESVETVRKQEAGSKETESLARVKREGEIKETGSAARVKKEPERKETGSVARTKKEAAGTAKVKKETGSVARVKKEAEHKETGSAARVKKEVESSKTEIEIKKDWTKDDFFNMCDVFLPKALARIVKANVALKEAALKKKR